MLLILMVLGLSQAMPWPDMNKTTQPAMNKGNEVPETEDVTSTILTANNGTTEFLVEGDILIPRTRNALKCISSTFSCLWEKSWYGRVEVPYTLSDDYNYDQKKKITDAMQDFHSKTCIRFVPRREERFYLDIVSRGGCFSAIGRIGDRQTVSLQKWGCLTRGTIQHELLHALGFYHEHTRSDRDQHVTINWDNISSYNYHNFYTQDTNNLNTPYDYQSVMHYNRFAFSKNGQDTITANNNVRFGGANRMSDIDIKRINKLYQC